MGSHLYELVCNTKKRRILQGLSLLLVGIIVILFRNRNSKSIDLLNVDRRVGAIKTNRSGSNFTHNRWIVVTSIFHPTKDVAKLAEIKGWHVLIVGDQKTPDNWFFPGCVFLGIDQQRQLGFRIAKHLPTNSYTRKIIGYLYAIQHGAKYIYDTDDDNHPSRGKINFHQEEFMSGLIYDDVTDDVMNPYAHFGQPSIWPRGFPLDRVRMSNNNTYKLCTFKTPAIQQGLVNGDPDVDAIFRLTRKEPNQRYINVTFDVRAPPVTLPEGVFAPFNSQNTFFSYDALWALFLPTSVAFRVTDIWRGYWAQRLLWLIGQRLSFFPPNAVQFRNSHDYLEDFKDENQFYSQTTSFIRFLKRWTCSASTFFECVSHLGHKMADEAFWTKFDAELLDWWLSDLKRVGYEEPRMSHVTDECSKSQHEEEKRRVYFSPVEQNSKFEGSGLREINRFCDNNFSKAVMNALTSEELLTKPSVVFDHILVVVVFNLPYYSNIRLLDALYYDHFPNIVYCGEVSSYQRLIDDINQGPFPWRRRNVTFINVPSSKGYFGYECAIRVMEMRYGVSGYLVLGDDVLLNYWNFVRDANLTHAHMQISSYFAINLTLGPYDISWPWWRETIGKFGTEKAMKELEILAQGTKTTRESHESRYQMISRFVENRRAAKLNMSIVSISTSDLYYVPESLATMFVPVMKVFLKHKVFLEIAVPTTIVGLSPSTATKQGFVGVSLWDNKRNIPLVYYNATKHYVHPVKFSRLFKETDMRNDFCYTYVEQLVKHW